MTTIFHFLNIFSIYLDRCFFVVCQLFPKINETGEGPSLREGEKSFSASSSGPNKHVFTAWT